MCICEVGHVLEQGQTGQVQVQVLECKACHVTCSKTALYAVQTRSFTLHVRATIAAVVEEARACVETKKFSEGDTMCYFN